MGALILSSLQDLVVEAATFQVGSKGKEEHDLLEVLEFVVECEVNPAFQIAGKANQTIC